MIAVHFAALAHRDQRRSNGLPYINHPIAVANLLDEHGYYRCHNIISAALLHDTIEDTDTTYTDLKVHFGQYVADLVLELTDDKTLPKATRKAMQIQRAPHMSNTAKLIKLADKICNMREMRDDWEPERVVEYYAHARQVFEGIRGVSHTLDSVFLELVLH